MIITKMKNANISENSTKANSKQGNGNDFHVIMKNNKHVKGSKEKPKEKKKRTTMREHIKAAKREPNPPMVF